VLACPVAHQCLLCSVLVCSGSATWTFCSTARTSSRGQRSDTRFCLEVPQTENSTSRLAPCNISSGSQKLLAQWDGNMGSVVSYARQDFYLCGYKTLYTWNTATL